jgi:competence protein ComEC
MRLALLAFALGVLALQQQPELPRLAWGMVIAAPLALSLAAFFMARRASGLIVRGARILALAAAVAAIALVGFFYAAWRAELRLADELASAWEAHGHALLYDTGPRFNEAADAGNRIIAPMLRAAGVTHLDGMVVSHQDSGGALSLLDTVPVEAFFSSLPPDSRIVFARAAQGEPARRCVAGQRWNWDGVAFAMLHPVEANYTNSKLKANDLSCVLRVSNSAGRALLTGDIEARTELDLLRRDAAALRAELLVVPHHGSRTSSTAGFIGAVSPRIAVFTPGYRNRFGHPRPEIVERYTKSGIESHRTDYEGALTFDFNPGTRLAAVAQRDLDRRYWYDTPLRSEQPPLD